jgi:hypothetical protein
MMDASGVPPNSVSMNKISAVHRLWRSLCHVLFVSVWACLTSRLPVILQERGWISKKSAPDKTTAETGSLHVTLIEPRKNNAAAEELGVKADVIRRDLGHVLLQLEALQDQQIKQALEPEEKQIPIGEQERAAAMELLRDRRLLDRILSDLERCGMVGEETNKL